jgi:AraC family transcriptional regulator
LTELAALVQISPHYFSQLFKQSTGTTPHKFVISCRVERAKELLLQGQLTIAEVAFIVGFANQSHLNRHFKKILNVTPRQFLSS